MVARSYVPDAGDLVWLTFDPQAGHEQRGRRPALILSPRAYNTRARLAIACPITSHVQGISVRGRPPGQRQGDRCHSCRPREEPGLECSTHRVCRDRSERGPHRRSRTAAGSARSMSALEARLSGRSSFAKPRRLDDAARIALVLLARVLEWRQVLVIVRPATLVRWHRQGLSLFWRWKSRRPGRPQRLIADMARANPTW